MKPQPTSWLAADALPRILFVLGKGGVGRSTVASALGVLQAERGERVLVLQWAVADCIGPWFGAPAVGSKPVAITPRLALSNFALEDVLRAYFVDHLHLGMIYRHIVRAPAVARVLEVAPVVAEMMFLGQLWWLITLAEREAGLHFDRIVVDAPATGHGASLFDVPFTVSTMGVSKLLAVETRRLTEMVADPERVGAIVVSLPEPLVIDETLELIPRVTARLGRPPLALIVNRSVATIATDAEHPAWLDELRGRVSARSYHAIAALRGELREHVELERELRRRVQSSVPSVALEELPGRAPIDVVRSVVDALGALR